MSEPRRMRPRCRGRRPSRPALRTGTSADGERTSEPGCFAGARNDQAFSRRIGVRVLRTTTTPSKILPSVERPQGGGAPKGASNHCPHGAIGSRHLQGASGAEAARCRGPLAFRRSDRGACPSDRTLRLSPGRASRERAGRRRYPHRQSRLNGAPRAPVVVPEGTMPGPPRRGVTKPARRNRTCSASGIVSRSVPRMSKISRP